MSFAADGQSRSGEATMTVSALQANSLKTCIPRFVKPLTKKGAGGYCFRNDFRSKTGFTVRG